jgi:hypothetical protein
MSFKPPTLYGFKVSNSLTDVIDPNSALLNLKLNINDLNIIRGASNDGAVREDLIAISDLKIPLYKTLDRYQGETSRYRGILENSGGVDLSLRGNLDVNGLVGASSVRYKFIDHRVQLNGTITGGPFILNEKITGGISDTISSGIIVEIGPGYIIVKDILGSTFNIGTEYTGSYSQGKITVSSIQDKTESKFADISTSRVSAWSTLSSGPTPSDSDPILYGGQLKIIDGGKITVDKITWGQEAIPRLKTPNNTFITGEIPTHTINVKINGSIYKLYAMKSIPLKISGFFRRFDGLIEFNSAVPNSRVSWRIVNVNNSSDVQLYTEVGTTSRSNLSYRSLTAAERNIEIYYHPDFITRIDLPGSGISELPAASLPALKILVLNDNLIKNMPNFKQFSPGLENLQFFRNSLFLSDDVNLRKFTREVADRLPSTLKTLNMHGTFWGSIECVNNEGTLLTGNLIGGNDSYSVIEKACPSLTSFSLSRGFGPFFNPDSYDGLSHLPSMPNSIISYSVQSNDFRRIPARGIKDLPNLSDFNVSSNWNLSDSGFSLTSNVIRSVNISATNLPIPNLSNRNSLVSFDAIRTRSAGSLFTNNNEDSSFKFSNCNQLESIDLRSSFVSGFIPKFTNNLLKRVDLHDCQNITGGRPQKSDFVLYNDTFESARGIQFFRVLSRSLLVGKGFESDTFKNLVSLSYLFWSSYGRTGGSEGSGIGLPDVSSCPNLDHLIMYGNNFEGGIPTLSSNSRIFYLDLSSNRLTGPIPTFSNRLNLAYVFLHNNRLTQFSGFSSTPRLIFAYLQNNLITGKIPMLGKNDNAPLLQRFYAFNNQFNDYEKGSFSDLTRIQFLDISRNNLTETSLSNIIDDLFENYNKAPRSRVSINLHSQSSTGSYNPSIDDENPNRKLSAEKIAFLRSKGWTITLG